MRIGLISPKSSLGSRNSTLRVFYERTGFVRSHSTLWTGFGSGLLAVAALTPRKHEVVLIDENKEEIDFSGKFDLIAIGAVTQQATRAYQIAKAFRSNGVPVALGGLHPTVVPEESMQHADSVVVGEAEYLWPELVRDCEAGTLKPIYKSDRTVDLKDVPVPRYDLLADRQPGMVWVQTTRGCPHDCEFCAATKVFGRAFRHKGVDQVVAEVEEVKRTCGNVMIGFADDNAFSNPSFSRDLLRAIIPLKIRFMAQTDIQIARHPDLLDLAARAGCSHLFVGFESAAAESLDGIDANGWKARQFAHYPEYIRTIQSYGIGVMGAFIIGLHADDADIFKRTGDFIVENHLFDVHVSVATPFPGTRLRKRLEEEDRIVPAEWENYTGLDLNFIHPKLTKEEIEQGVCQVYERAYSEETQMGRYAFYKQMHREMLKRQAAAQAGSGAIPESGPAGEMPRKPALT